jgi:hypothetical protein
MSALRRVGRSDLSPAAFRKAFFDWAEDYLNLDSSPAARMDMSKPARRVIARARGWRVFDARDIYDPQRLLEEQRTLMEAWARYCQGKTVAPR